MASDTRVSNEMALLYCNGIVDELDTGTAVAQGYVQIRTGAPPADVETAVSGSLLAQIDFNNPAFGAAADQNPGARAALITTTAVETTSADATTTGTAGYYRTFNRDNTGVWQNTAGGPSSGEGMELSSATISPGQTVTITSWNVDVPET